MNIRQCTNILLFTIITLSESNTGPILAWTTIQTTTTSHRLKWSPRPSMTSQPKIRFYCELYDQKRSNHNNKNSFQNTNVDEEKWNNEQMEQTTITTTNDVVTSITTTAEDSNYNYNNNTYKKEKKTIQNFPRHIGIVMDGNTRWAKKRNVPIVIGHVKGADKLMNDILHTIINEIQEIQYCTVYCFSTENWKRPLMSIHDLFTVMEKTAQNFYPIVMERKNVRIKIIGDIYDIRIPNSLRNILLQLETDTFNNTMNNNSNNDSQSEEDSIFTLCLAINYGGRQDIIHATKRIVGMVQNGTISNMNDINKTLFESCLYTNTIPDPDLMIRTSGEHRISNFLLWNVAYTELYITNTLWPDFNSKELYEALTWYSKRQRRFGDTSS